MKWIIENMKRQTESGLVIEVVYRVIAKEKSLIADHKGKVILTGNSESEGFVPFEELTESLVIQWVKDNVDVSSIETEVQNLLDSKLEKLEQRTTSSGLPWNIW